MFSLSALQFFSLSLPLPLAAAPLTLEDAVHLALLRNPTIKVESYTPDIARANLLSALGFFDPALNFRREYSHEELPSAAALSGLPPTVERSLQDDYSLSLDGILPWGLQYSLGASARNLRGTFNGFADHYETFGGVTVTQPLLHGFGFSNTLAGVRLAKADRAISDWDYRHVVIDTITRVIFAYHDLLHARRSLQISQESRDLALSLLAANERRFEVGSMSRSDVIEARARAARREEAILIADRASRDTEVVLRQLIGGDIFAGLPLEIAALPPAPTVTVSPSTDVSIALELRPDYQAARFVMEHFRLNDRRARNQMLPRVDFVGSYGRAGADRDFSTSRRQLRTEDITSWSAGVVVSVPITFAEERGRARAARLQYHQAQENLKRFEQEIAVEVAHAAGQVETTRERILAAQRAFDLGREALAAEEKKLAVGTSNTFFVLELQESLSELERRLVRAEVDHRKALAQYDRVRGLTPQRLKLTLQ